MKLLVFGKLCLIMALGRKNHSAYVGGKKAKQSLTIALMANADGEKDLEIGKSKMF